MRLIDGDSAVQQIRKFVGCHKDCSENFYYGLGCKACAWGKIIEIVENAPTIKAEPVVHGEWLPTRDSNKKECSNCGVIHLIAQYPHGQANYCPNCGKRMTIDLAELWK